MSHAVMLDENEKGLAELAAKLPATKNTAWVVCHDPNGTGWRLERRGRNTGRCFEASVGLTARTRTGLYYTMKGYLERRIELGV